MSFKFKSIEQFVSEKNADKILFTAGPSSLLAENLTGLMPCFGRGDSEYLSLEKRVLNLLKLMTGKNEVIRLQGSASLALEIMHMNYLFGKILVVSTGYYSECAKLSQNKIQSIERVDWKNIGSTSGSYDWVVACSTETSCGLKIPINALHKLSKSVNAKLMLDATASIGLEPDHNLADVLAFSSCKGLFGLTGAAFIAFDEKPSHDVSSFYMSFLNHYNKKMTGPYHSIASLANVLPNHNYFRESVVINKQRFLKKMESLLLFPEEHQPLLCTQIKKIVVSDNRNVVLYSSRNNSGGSVVCHLGEAHLGAQAKGSIIENLMVEEKT